MDLAAVRAGLRDTLDALPDVRVAELVPAQPPVGAATLVVLAPGSPYVEYPASLGKALSRQAKVRFTVTVIPPPADLAEAQRSIDRHLSSGSAEDRSIRDALERHQGHGGVACQTSVLTASVVTLQAAGVDYTAAELEVELMVRTS